MKKIALLLSFVLLTSSAFCMEPEEKKEHTVEIRIGGQDVSIPIDAFDEYGDSLAALTGDDLSSLQDTLTQEFGQTVLIFTPAEKEKEKAQEFMQKEAKKKREARKQVSKKVADWFKRQDPQKTERLKTIWKLKLAIEKERIKQEQLQKALEEERKKLKKEKLKQD